MLYHSPCCVPQLRNFWDREMVRTGGRMSWTVKPFPACIPMGPSRASRAGAATWSALVKDPSGTALAAAQVSQIMQRLRRELDAFLQGVVAEPALCKTPYAALGSVARVVCCSSRLTHTLCLHRYVAMFLDRSDRNGMSARNHEGDEKRFARKLRSMAVRFAGMDTSLAGRQARYSLSLCLFCSSRCVAHWACRLSLFRLCAGLPSWTES